MAPSMYFLVVLVILVLNVTAFTPKIATTDSSASGGPTFTRQKRKPQAAISTTSSPVSTRVPLSPPGSTGGCAPGLLSPATVYRLELSRLGFDDSTADAVNSFLRTYRSEGPMACMPYLADPAILPELTKAMGESIAR
mmetsp:Transcript_17850/g.37104  ORF Transcript_17850/g.37104 Transcript_17850/m.37104 type:complete len:138 (-) Transcript_17850:195-608(-)